MSQIASKNLYELLGNDLELDPNREPEPPTKVIDKPVQRTGKRNPAAEGAAKDAPRPAAAARGGRTDAAGAQKPREDRPRREPRGDGAGRSERGRGRGRGGRGDGARGARPVRDDRHSHTGIGEHEKQAGHGWGFQEGSAEWTDEKAGADLAAAEAKNDDSADPAASTGPDGVNAAPEPEEDNTKSYEQYLADLKEKRQALAGDSLAIRKPNEGSSQKFPEGKPVERAHEEYFAGAGAKQHRAKETKTKNSLALDGQYYAAPDTGDRGRGGARGGRGADGNRPARTARDDRHSHTGIGEHEKQAGHGWGKVEGQAEWSDEKAGADIAATEVKDAAGNTEPEVAAAPEPEEEDNTKSYEQYLADLAEKRQALAGDSLAIRKANEGSSQKFPEGKPVERAHEEYFAGAGAKQHRAKENKTKNSLALDGQYYAAPDTGDRGRGGARGGRGEGRGGRGRGEGRGRGGRGRGEGRGGAPSGARTEQRSGPRGGAINTKDESAFPSLGA